MRFQPDDGVAWGFTRRRDHADSRSDFEFPVDQVQQFLLIEHRQMEVEKRVGL